MIVGGGVPTERPVDVRISIGVLITGVLLSACASACGGGARSGATPSEAATTGMSVGSSSSSPFASPARAHVAVGAGPDGITYASGSVWTANFDEGTVSRIDPVSMHVAASIAVDAGPITVAAAGNALWVASFTAGTVSRIDVTTNRVSATVATGTQPVGLSFVGSTLWVFNQGDGTAAIIDVTTGRRLSVLRTGVQAGWSSYALGQLWVPDFLGQTDRVVEIDPRTGRVRRRVAVGVSPIAVSFAAGSGWTSNPGDRTVTRFDPVTGRKLASIRIPGGDPGALLATPQAVWVSVYGGSALARIDPRSNTVTATVPTATHPQNMVLVGDDLWLAEGSANDVAVIPVTAVH